MVQASALMRRGFSREDKLSFISRNRPEFLESFFGVPYAGGVLVPINFRLSPKEMAYIINHSDSKFVVVDEPYLNSLLEVRTRLRLRSSSWRTQTIPVPARQPGKR